MGWSFKLHAGIAAGLSALLMVLGALTWLPGTLPLTGTKWPMAVIATLLFPVFVAAVLRGMLTGADRSAFWLAFSCLPGRVRAGLGALAVSGVVLLFAGLAGAGNLQAPEVRDGRYFVLDTTPHERGVIEVSRSEYVSVLEDDQRMMFAIPGLLFAGAAYFVLATGELRRADARGTAPRPDTGARSVR
ncbi:hypothetical protein [Streptomyces albus]|uniref:hypothetical protein n=1 Tax=Streptomyces albus TaxID=1888 RepID=UPI0004C69D99|nr:hypothetical protein [Streptomyces albus]